MRQRLVTVGLLLSAVVNPTGAAVPARHLEAPETDPHASSGTANPSRATRRDVPFAGKAWEFMGPTLMTDGQVENIPLPGTSFFNPVIGAIHTVAAHPTNPDILFIGATNGGVWSTNSATNAEPSWIPRSDAFPSQSIGALEFDPTDANSNTIVAGTGRYSSFGRNGGVRGYIYRSTDGGETWTVNDQLITRNISGIAARGETIVCSVNVADNFVFNEIGIWRSTDGGANFEQVSVSDGSLTGLPGGVCYDLAGDPVSTSRLYTSTVFSNLVGGTNGVYRSDDIGANWVKVSSAEMDALITDGTSNIEIAVGRSGEVYVSILNTGAFSALFRSPSGDAGTFVRMDLPATNENGVDVGLNPSGGKGPGPGSPAAEIAGGQGSIHSSIRPSPTNTNLIFVGGDRQPHLNELANPGNVVFPNSIGANDYSGRLFRGDFARAAGTQFAHLTHSDSLPTEDTLGGTASSSSPHADSREIVFDANGDLIEVDDGGIYRRTNPNDNTGDWFSLNGDLGVTEAHDVAWDPVANVVMIGNQDTGTAIQFAEGDTRFFSFHTADGGDVAAFRDPSNPDQSIRYSSFQFLFNFRRSVWDSANNFVDQSFPALSGYDGSGRFVTGLEVNTVDPTRFVFVARNNTYESFDQGASVVSVGPGVNSSFQNAIAYGGRLNGEANADVLYYATGATIRVRLDGASAAAAVAYPGSDVFDIVLDPADYRRAYVTDSTSRVWFTSNAGASFSEITGDLAASQLRTIVFLPGPNPGVAVGSRTGMWFMKADTPGTWTLLGESLPTVPVWDSVYNAEDDILVVGTLGRGAWAVRDIVPDEPTGPPEGWMIR